MKAPERAERDQNALRMFLAGATYVQIGAVVELSTKQVHRIVQKELASAAQRRALLTDEALAIYQERVERLFQAHWAPALKGDHRSAEICRRMLAQQARLYGLDEALELPNPTSALPSGGSADDDEQSPEDELARLRAARAGA